MEEIDISFPSKQFEKHLLDNDRILFSGKFGVGKTTFLKHFFKNEENVYWINPIDYTFTRDTDIFQQIKYDILLHLVSKNAFKGKTELSEFFHAFAYIYSDNLQPFILENIAGKDGKVIFDTFKHIKSIFNKYQIKDKGISWKYIKKINKFRQSFESQYDYKAPIDILINEGLKKIQKQGEGENILIVDDIDRLDPSNVMRIFNAFSIYTITDNNQEVGNTYNNIGFNKIILVCDFDNVKNFFKHVYGDRTDIRGYFDKFIDKQVFYFTNNGEIKKFIKKIVDSKYISSSASSDQKDYEIEISSLQNILSDLYFNGLINLRELQVFDYRIKSYQRRPYSVPSKWGKLYSRKVPGLLVIETMYILLDFDWERIKNAFYQLSFSVSLVTDRNLIIDYSYFIPLLGDNLITESESSKFGANGKSFEGTYKTKNDHPNIEFNLNFKFESSYTLIYCNISSKELEGEENNHKHFNKINLVQELNHLIYNTLLELEKNAYPGIAENEIKSQFITTWHDKVCVKNQCEF